ncbi:MAG: DUF3135 domain-containing protein [Pseudomonadota bacterium]
MTKLPSFDELRKMAIESPEKLDELLERETAKIIEAAPAHLKERMNGLQFQIEAQRRISKNPVDRMVRIFRMMNESFFELNEALRPFRPQAVQEPVKKQTLAPNAMILDFPKVNSAEEAGSEASKKYH